MPPIPIPFLCFSSPSIQAGLHLPSPRRSFMEPIMPASSTITGSFLACSQSCHLPVQGNSKFQLQCPAWLLREAVDTQACKMGSIYSEPVLLACTATSSLVSCAATTSHTSEAVQGSGRWLDLGISLELFWDSSVRQHNGHHLLGKGEQRPAWRDGGEKQKG